MTHFTLHISHDPFHTSHFSLVLIPDTEWKVSKYEVISGPYFPVFSPNAGKYGPEMSPYLDTFNEVKGLARSPTKHFKMEKLATIVSGTLFLIYRFMRNSSWRPSYLLSFKDYSSKSFKTFFTGFNVSCLSVGKNIRCLAFPQDWLIPSTAQKKPLNKKQYVINEF